MFQTEFEFKLPCGYLDPDGTLQREGVMRRANAADEILPLKDPRVVKNPAYLVVILLSRVVIRLGSVEQITPHVIENLYATDLAYLQNLYNEVNRLDGEGDAVVCPECRHEFRPEESDVGGVVGYPLDALRREVAFVAYHFSWPPPEIMALEHAERRRWAGEISAINREMNGE